MPFFNGGDMQAEFGLIQEQRNKLYCKETKNANSPLHFHSQLELYFVDEGEMEIWVNNDRAVLGAGEMSVALSYDAHSYRSIGATRANYIIIPTYMCEEFIHSFKGKQSKTPFIRDAETVKKLRACYDELKKDTSNKVKTLGYIYVMLGILMESISIEDARESIDPKLSSQLLFYINENYKNDITLTSIATELGYHPSYLSRYFKSCFGIGINQYVTVVRLKQAVLLMQDGKNSITYCAFESGFNSMRTFYRAFFEEFRCTPREYTETMKTKYFLKP